MITVSPDLALKKKVRYRLDVEYCGNCAYYDGNNFLKGGCRRNYFVVESSAKCDLFERKNNNEV